MPVSGRRAMPPSQKEALGRHFSDENDRRGRFRAENGSQRGWKRGKRAGNYEMREKREKWGVGRRKREKTAKNEG